MRRQVRIILPVIVVICIAVVVVLATGVLSGSHTSSTASATAPSCLPTKLDPSAKLAGVPVDVSPAPETVTANPDTQISFLGVPAPQISSVSVIGQQSGKHPGRLEAYSQGDGASFVLSSPFQAGEHVSVHASIAGKPVSFAFRVDTPYPTANVPPYKNPPAPASDLQSFPTMPGVQVPILEVTVPDHDPAAGDIFTSNGPGAGPYGPLIYNPQGQLIWFDPLSGGQTAEDLNVQSYEGQRDLTFWQGKVLEFGFGQGEDIVMNSHYQTVTRLRGANGLKPDLHEFQIAPHGVAYVTAYNPIRCNLSSVEEGPSNGAIIDTSVQEIDMKTGLVRWEWHTLDHIPVNQSHTSPPSNRPWDWFHLNSIDPEPDGNVLISGRSMWAAYQLEGGTGKVLWQLGGLESSFEMGPGTKTAWQHDARMLPNGEITMFDDGANPPVHSQSRGVRIKLDFQTHKAHLSAVYTHPNTPLLAASQGNMQTLANGDTVIEYGGVPQISEYSPSGSLLFDAHLPYELISYRGYRYPWSARPAAAPAIVASLNNTAEETIVHASWNGATDVASWRILAGKSAATLKPISTFPDSGFESSGILTKAYPQDSEYAYVQVQALSSSGLLLDSSRIVQPSSYTASLQSTKNSG